jgi:hypothetical protein
MKAKRNLIAAAVLLTLATAPAWAVLERVGPVDNSPAAGGFPAWIQDKTGVAFEFCAPSTQAELDGGWCLLLPGDANVPESFPANFFDEHFYWAADNILSDAALGFSAKLVLALEAAFANGPAAPGDQMAFGRLRVQTTGAPFDGDYRVVTPFSDITYFDVAAGQRIFDTLDIGTGCPATFECSLAAPIGPFLLPSAIAGGAEVPPMPDLQAAPPGTDPYYDQLVAQGGVTPTPGTGKRYVADPGRVGTVTGSPLPDFTAYNTDGTTALRNHNTFRIEVRPSTPTRDGAVFYTLDGESNFSLMGRLMTGTLEGKVSGGRAVYKADATGNVTALDVFTAASPTTVARLPAQPVQPAVQPILSVYDVPCAGAIAVDPVTGATTINAGPYSAPAGATPHTMLATGSDYWAQTQPGGLPPSHVCIVDETARNAQGQVIPAYYLRKVTDEVTINTAAFDGANNGTLSVTAVSSDPTAVLTLGGYGPATAPGTAVGKGSGTGVEMAAGSASVSSLQAPPSAVQVVSSKGGAAHRNTDTSTGTTVLFGVPTALADSASISEDGGPVTIDLLANDTISLNGTVTTLRSVVTGGQGTVVVTPLAARLGTASVSADGILTYTPNLNANGTDSVAYSVSVNGAASNTAQAAISIAAVNDAPVAVNTTVGAVVGKLNVMNLIGTSADVDAPGEVKEAVITSWPAQLGAAPTPMNGVIWYTPTAAGTYTFTYQVSDVLGALSANTATGTVNVALNEIITFDKHQYVQNKNRWTVNGTDNVIEGQTITIVYENGLLKGATVPCNGTAENPSCVIGTSLVDGLGAWGIDKVGTGKLNPKDTTVWQVQPTHIRAFSTLPALGGTAAIDIVFK